MHAGLHVDRLNRRLVQKVGVGGAETHLVSDPIFFEMALARRSCRIQQSPCFFKQKKVLRAALLHIHRLKKKSGPFFYRITIKKAMTEARVFSIQEMFNFARRLLTAYVCAHAGVHVHFFSATPGRGRRW